VLYSEEFEAVHQGIQCTLLNGFMASSIESGKQRRAAVYTWDSTASSIFEAANPLDCEKNED